MVDPVRELDLACRLCRVPGPGRTVLEGLHDHRYGVTGSWALHRCDGCGLVVLDPPPGEHSVAYPSEYSQHRSPASPSAARSPLLRWLRAHVMGGLGYPSTDAVPTRCPSALGRLLVRLPAVRVGAQFGFLLVPPAKAGGRLLDVGCGNGRFLALAAELGWDVAGVEVDPISAALARASIADSPVVDDVGDPRLEAHSFDVITMNHVVEHIEDFDTLLRRLRRLCADGGRLAIATPNWSALTRRIFGRNWYTLDAPRHPVLFGRANLVSAVEAAGFRVESVATRAVRDAPVNWRLSWRYRWGRDAPRTVVWAGTAVSAVAALFGMGEEIELWASTDGSAPA